MQRFNTLLKNPELGALRMRTQETQDAQKIWNAIAPDNLAKFSRASSIKNKQLNVYADNSVVAAKIKHLLPSLLIQLQKQVCEVTAIRVKVQVKSSPQPRRKTLRKLTPAAVSSLKELSEKLAGTALGDALDKLCKTAD